MMAKGSSNLSLHFPKSQRLSFSFIAFLLCNSAVTIQSFIPNPKLVEDAGASSASKTAWVHKTSMSKELEAVNPGPNSAFAQLNTDFQQNQRTPDLRSKRLQSFDRPPSGSYSVEPEKAQKPQTSSPSSTSSTKCNSVVKTNYLNQNSNLANSAGVGPFIPDAKLVEDVRASLASKSVWVPKKSTSEELEATKPGPSAAVAQLNTNFRQNQCAPDLWFKRLQSSGRTPSGIYFVQPAKAQKPQTSLPPLTSSIHFNSAVNTKNYNPNSYLCSPQYHASPALISGLNPHAHPYHHHLVPAISNGQYFHPPMKAQTTNGEFWWNIQSASWKPVPISVESSQDEGKLWEDIDHDIFDLVHNKGSHISDENEPTKQDNLLTHNQKPLQEAYSSFFDSHSPSTPEVSPKKSPPNTVSDKPNSKPEQGGMKEKQLTNTKVAPQPSDLKTESHEDSDSSDDWDLYNAEIYAATHNEKSDLSSESLQLNKHYNKLFGDNSQDLTSTPASHPIAWPSLSHSDIRGPDKEAHHPVYSQAMFV